MIIICILVLIILVVGLFSIFDSWIYTHYINDMDSFNFKDSTDVESRNKKSSKKT